MMLRRLRRSVESAGVAACVLAAGSAAACSAAGPTAELEHFSAEVVEEVTAEEAEEARAEHEGKLRELDEELALLQKEKERLDAQLEALHLGRDGFEHRRDLTAQREDLSDSLDSVYLDKWRHALRGQLGGGELEAHQRVRFTFRVSNTARKPIEFRLVCRVRDPDGLIRSEHLIFAGELGAGWRKEYSVEKLIPAADQNAWTACKTGKGVELVVSYP